MADKLSNLHTIKHPLAFPPNADEHPTSVIENRARGRRFGPVAFGGVLALESDRAIGLMNDMLWTCVMVAGPILVATLLVGLAISVFQVATQLQEITLSYVPKLMTAAILLILLGPWMIARITDFARNLFIAIPALVL